MASWAGAFQRRFLLGPLVALALIGPGGDLTGANGPAPAPGGATSTPAPEDPTAPARAMIMNALEAEQVYRVDHFVFASAVGGELEELRSLDPSVGWGKSVIVELPNAEGQEGLVVVLRAPLPDGSSLCLSEVTTEQDAGLWYARASVGGHCPKVRHGMRGWFPDEASGWAV